MSDQIIKTMYEYCVLSIINTQDSYGYQIIKESASIIDITESTLYPILKRLESANRLTSYTKEHNGRLRKYYSITTDGKMYLTGFISSWDNVIHVFDYIKERSIL